MRFTSTCLIALVITLLVPAAASAQPLSGPGQHPEGPRIQPHDDAAPPGVRRARDYVVPTRETIARRKAFTNPGGPCFECGRRQVGYTDFGDRSHTLIQYSGRRVALLLPRSWPGGNGFTEDEIRFLLDRADLIYEHAADLMGREPAGNGLLPVAFVPETCGWGCGFIAAKGVEVLDADWSVDGLRQGIDAGVLHPVLVHEITHNFDLFWSHLWFLPDHGHAWTDFLEFFLTSYSGMGGLVKEPRAYLRDWVRDTWKPYLEDPSATWERCVRDGACGNRGIRANGAWAGPAHRVGMLHGARTVRRAMAFLGNEVDTAPPPTGPGAREDLRIEALATGATTNLSCHMDSWRWHASPALRAAMASRYGGRDPACNDLDGDGFSPSKGDCDDSDSLAHPDRAERSNGVDDDCDGLVDELEVFEAAAGEFPGSLSRPFRVDGFGEIRGTASTVQDADFFSITLDRPRTVSFEICGAPEFEGFLFAYRSDGTWQGLVSTPPGRSCGAFRSFLDREGTWRFGIDGAATAGRYVIRVQPADPREAWGQILPPLPRADGYLLRATATNAPGGPDAPTHVRFWVSGFGFVGTVPYSDVPRLRWRPGKLPAGTYTVRAQLLSRTVPVSDVTSDRATLLGGDCVSGASRFCAPPPFSDWLTTPEMPGFEVQVRINSGGQSRPGAKVERCIGETLCVSGAVPGRAEIFARMVGPKPNGNLWPTLVKFTTSEVEVWVRQIETGVFQYYRLAGAAPGRDELPGLADKEGFRPGGRAAGVSAGAPSDQARDPDGPALPAAGGPPPPAGPWLTTPELPGFRTKVRISAAGTSIEGSKVASCIGETLCVSGAFPGRAEVFVRVPGPKPNGKLWPTLVKFTTSRAQVWIQQIGTGRIAYYDLPGVAPGGRLLELDGLFDRNGFDPR